ncbi:MAG TPA: hypothetical protein VM689_20705 [Aliidongia sp.]|nr:hypothetical protein [Aliidongia sp.]
MADKGSSTAESEQAPDSGNTPPPSPKDALNFLGKAINSDDAPWVVRLRAAALILEQGGKRPAKAAPRSKSRTKAKPKPETETEAETGIDERIRAVALHIEEVMATHGNAAMDNTDPASDPGRLLEQQAPVQHGPGGAAIG